MKWLGKQLREQHTTLNQWCSSSTHTKPQGKCWHNTNMCYSTEVHVKSTILSETHQTHSKKTAISGNYTIQKRPGFPLLLLLLPPFTFNGDRGDRWRELLTLLPPLPLLSTSPFPWCLCLNYISALASTATLFTHSSIHIHLACTCLVPARVTWRERTHKTCALRTNTDQVTHICSSSPLRWWGSRRAMEMSEGGREEIKILGQARGRK